MRAFVAGVGLFGPGLVGWEASRPVLAAAEDWVATEIAPPASTLLAANERRRAGLPARLALAVSEAALAMAELAPDAVRCVFGSGLGEGAILDALLQTLAEDPALVSPSQFHNSVHNAVAGYWTVAAGSRQPATCLGAHGDTFAATLLKAAAEVAVEQAPVLMCVYDVPLPEPLAAKMPTGAAFACALVLVPRPVRGALAELSVGWRAGPPEPGADVPDGDACARLSRSNPAARSLRLLQALARQRPDRAAYALLDGSVCVETQPCSTASASPP